MIDNHLFDGLDSSPARLTEIFLAFQEWIRNGNADKGTFCSFIRSNAISKDDETALAVYGLLTIYEQTQMAITEKFGFGKGKRKDKHRK